MSQYKTFPYSDHYLNHLRHLIQPDETKIPKDYAIRVDGMDAVERTNDLSHFARHIDLIDPQVTKTVEVDIFKGDTNFFSHFVLQIEKPKPEGESLSGTSESILEQGRIAWEYDALQKRFDAMKKLADKYESENDKLVEELEALKSRPLQLGSINGSDFLGSLIGGFFGNHAESIEKKTGIPLDGMKKKWASDGVTSESDTDEDGSQDNTGFERVDDGGEMKLDSEQQSWLELHKAIRNRLNKRKEATLISLVEFLIQSPKWIEHVLKAIQKVKQPHDTQEAEAEINF
jgi:hypothetical protein